MFVYRQATADRCEEHLISNLVVKVIQGGIKQEAQWNVKLYMYLRSKVT